MLYSGCTTHTWPADAPLSHKKPTPPSEAIDVGLPNGTSMRQSHEGSIPFPNVPPAARLAKVYHGHSYKPLLSLGQFCDSGYVFSGCSEKIILTHPNRPPLYARRCHTSGMYLVSFNDPTDEHQQIPRKKVTFATPP